MYSKKHAAEHEEQARKQAEREARRAREEKVRAETRRLDRQAEEVRKRRRKSRDRRREVDMRVRYDVLWKDILTAGEERQDRTLRFWDIPWPVMFDGQDKSNAPAQPFVSMDYFTAEAISTFLLSARDDSNSSDEKKERKEKLRETMLRYHPDKFEGRVMARVAESDKDSVREALGVVVRTVSDLMAALK